MKKMSLYKLILLVSISLYIISLSQLIVITEPNSDIVGFFALITGWGVSEIWLANPILFASWYFLNIKPKLALTGSLLSTIISLSFLKTSEIMVNEAGQMNKIIDFKMGYWLWLSSSIILCIGSGIIVFFSKQETEREIYV